MDPDLLHLVIFLSTTLAFRQPRMIEAGAYGPHPELLQRDPNNPSSKGNEFVLGFMGNVANAPIETATVALFVTTDDPGPVEFTVEYFDISDTYEAREGKTTLAMLPLSPIDIRIVSESERNKGVRVKATDPTKLLTVYGINDAPVSADTFLALPCHRYPVVNYRYFVFSTFTLQVTAALESRFLIVPCEDDTTVSLQPTQQILIEPDLTGQTVPQPIPAGGELRITMDRLQTAQFNSADDLTGSIIISDKPISVFVGHECGQVPGDRSACDHLVEQLPPDTTWGTLFFTIPLDVRESGEHYRIGTVTDNNQVYVTCTTEGQAVPHFRMTETIHSQRGQNFAEFNTVGDNTDGVTPNYRRDFCCIETTKPAIVMMYSKGHSADEITLPGVSGTQGDPFMLLVPPVSQYSNDYTVFTTARQLGTNFVGHISYALPSQFFNNSTFSRSALMVNETAFVPDSGYHPIYCSNGEICGFGAYSGLPAGDHKVTYNISGAAMMLYVYGIQREKSFGYPAGFEMQAIGAPRICIINVTVLESVGYVRIPINRTGGDLSLVSVIRASSRDASALAGHDYVPLSNFRIRWRANQVDPRYILNPTNFDPVYQINITDDDIPENLEYFEIDLIPNPGGNGNSFFYPNAVGRVTIIDDDTPPWIGFESTIYDFSEGTGIATLQILTNNPERFTNASGALLYTTDGTATSNGDFTGITRANAEPIIFAAGQPTTTVSINITDDLLAEGSENFSVHIVSGGGISNLTLLAPVATINIADNDVFIIGFEQPVFTVMEGTEQHLMLEIRVNQDSNEIAEEVVLVIHTTDGSAVALQDYMNISNMYLNFSSGEQRHNVVVTILDDDMFESVETFSVTMSVMTGDATILIDTPVATVKIINNDLIDIGFENEMYNFTESVNESACLTIRKFNNPSTLINNISILFMTMDDTAEGGRDFTRVKSTVIFLPHETKIVTCVTINDDLIPEERESFYCTLDISEGSEGIAQVTVSRATVFIEANDVSRFEVQCNSEDVPDRGNCSENGLCKVMITTESTTVECTSCASGFIGNGILCEDIDECANRQHNCAETASCSNLPGLFTCDCMEGHFGNGTVCLSAANKIPYRCEFCVCFNESSDIWIQCGCLPGYEAIQIEGGTLVCRDINECLRIQSSCNGTCYNTNGSYHCSCPAGYFYDTEERTCADLDECQLGIHNCHKNATCTNNDGSFSCTCNVIGGFFGDGVTCFNDSTKCEQLMILLSDMSEIKSFECGCQAGYHLNMSTFQQCEDVDECQLGVDNCDGNATCNNTDGSYNCDCKNGFIGDGTICNDINECATGLHQCDKNADCNNTIGSFTCDCRDGFFGNGMECAAGIGPIINTTTVRVRPNRDLNYTIGTNFCLEDPVLNMMINQMQLMMNLRWIVSCQLANQPIPIPKFTMTIAVVRNGIEMEIPMSVNQSWTSYDVNSTAYSLFQPDTTTTTIKVTCVVSNTFGSDNASTLIERCGINECQDGITNECTQLCSIDNETMTYNCSCMNGYVINKEDPNKCDDLNECAHPAFNNCSAAENQECLNTVGSFTCRCKTGYSIRSDGLCEDIDECVEAKLNNCSQANSEKCQNINGSFVCVCMDGYRRINATQQCKDIDECMENTHTCSESENEICVNTNGAFNCSCIHGYRRNTTDAPCSDIDECNDQQVHDQCTQECRNTNGSYECYCTRGYILSTFNNRLCIDIDECADNDTICPIVDNKECHNTDGSYTCNCIPGYIETGINGICKDTRECNPPCHRFAVCTNTSSGTFGCQCMKEYEGDGIDNCQLSADVIYGILGGVLFLLLIAIVITITIICLRRCYTRRSNYDVKEKDNLGNQGSHLDSEFGESQPTFSVQTSYKLNLPPHLIIHSSSIKLVETIGQGEFGIVYKGHIVKDPGPVVTDIVAIKTLKGFYDKTTVRELMKECSKMHKFDHPNVLTLKGVCLDGGPAPFIIMPFMANGSLLTYLHKKRNSLVITEGDKDDEEVKDVEKQLMDMCLQIAKGMEYLTVMNVVHRDLAARNCMIDMNFVIKVADFGLSESIGSKQYFRQDKFADVKLPIRWLAPESLEDGIFSQKSDVWAYGVTCWEVFTGGKTPYPGISPTDLPRQLANGYRLEKPINYACSDEMYSFMLNCWKLEPNARPSFSDLVSLLSQFLEAMVGYMDAFAFEKQEDKSGIVKVPSTKNISEDISSDICAETVM